MQGKSPAGTKRIDPMPGTADALERGVDQGREGSAVVQAPSFCFSRSLTCAGLALPLLTFIT